MATVQALPRDVSKLGQEVKLFGKWETHGYAPHVCSDYGGRLNLWLQNRNKRHLPPRLHSNPPRRLPPSHRWSLRQEAVQEGPNAHRRATGGQVRAHRNCTRTTVALTIISLMMKGRNNGKKLLALRIVAHAFEIIHLLTDQNPIQVRPPIGTSTLVLIRCRYWLMLSSTPVLVRTLPVSVHKEPSVVRQSMSRLCGESTRPSPS